LSTSVRADLRASRLVQTQLMLVGNREQEIEFRVKPTFSRYAHKYRNLSNRGHAFFSFIQVGTNVSKLLKDRIMNLS
jgi:hypothetical protein